MTVAAARSLSRRFARNRVRRGVSILEFLGCFSAMVGGVVLGSMYLGVDVKEMAYTALERAQVIDTRKAPTEQPLAATEPVAPSPAEVVTIEPQTNAPASVTTPVAEPAPATPSVDAPVAVTSPSESATTPTEAAPATPATDAPAAGFFAREDLITDEQRQVLTRAYWEALGACMQDEVTHRVPAIDAEGNWQLFDYLTGRKDGHLKAAAGIAALDRRGVDDHVLAYGSKAQAWHEDGAKLFGRAVDLLTDAPTAQLSGPFAQSWQSASTQHRMEARLLVEKQQAVESYLSHAYQPAPAEPAAP